MPGRTVVDPKTVRDVGTAVRISWDSRAPTFVFSTSTVGDAIMHGTAFFRAAAAACGLLRERGLLLTKYPHQIPADLPPGVRHVAFAPFRQLLPRCAAIVHHGGIGTTAAALTAATPQLVLPLAWDQPDNARRFLNRYGNPFAASGVDANGRAAIEWGVYGVPETFVVGRDGRIAYKLIGPIDGANFERVVKPRGAVLLNLGYATGFASTPMRCVAAIEDHTNYRLVDTICWKKPKARPMSLSPIYLRRCCEFVFVFGRRELAQRPVRWAGHRLRLDRAHHSRPSGAALVAAGERD